MCTLTRLLRKHHPQQPRQRYPYMLEFNDVLPHISVTLSSLLSSKSFSTLSQLNKYIRAHVLKSLHAFNNWKMICTYMNNSSPVMLKTMRVPLCVKCKLIPFLFTKNSIELHYSNNVLFLSYESFFFIKSEHSINLRDLFHPQQDGVIDFYNLDFHTLPRCEKVVTVSLEETKLLLVNLGSLKLLDIKSRSLSDVQLQGTFPPPLGISFLSPKQPNTVTAVGKKLSRKFKNNPYLYSPVLYTLDLKLNTSTLLSYKSYRKRWGVWSTHVQSYFASEKQILFVAWTRTRFNSTEKLKLFVFDTLTSGWSRLKPKGQLPCFPKSTTLFLCALDDRAFLITQAFETHNIAIYLLDLINMNWKGEPLKLHADYKIQTCFLYDWYLVVAGLSEMILVDLTSVLPH